MQTHKLLDCTLRDGGYVNDWQFGLESARGLALGLEKVNIDIVELGFISNKSKFDKNQTKFDSFFSLEEVFTKKIKKLMKVVMINFGEFSLDEIPKASRTIIDGIRIAFHKKDFVNAMKFAQSIKEKGYKIFIQPMVSKNYDAREFSELLDIANKLDPYAFYIVDSFGSMNEEDLSTYLKLIRNILNKNIHLGFHLHDNMQKALCNYQWALRYVTDYNLIFDATLNGIGRGAGNLKTELVYTEINGFENDAVLLLDLIDKYILPIKSENTWGFSNLLFITATKNMHPNYALFLDRKFKGNFGLQRKIIELIPEEEKVYFNLELVAELAENHS